MKLSVQPHQASQGRRFAIVDEHGDIMLTTFDATDQSRELAHQAAAAPDMLAFIKSVAEGASVEGRWLSADGEAIDGYDTENDEPPADEWPDATWEPYTEEEQAQYLYGIASQARALIAKAEGRADA